MRVNWRSLIDICIGAELSVVCMVIGMFISGLISDIEARIVLAMILIFGIGILLILIYCIAMYFINERRRDLSLK